MPHARAPSPPITLASTAWLLLLAMTPAPAQESLRWDAEQVVADPYVLNQLDFITLSATNLGTVPVTISDVRPSCSCIAYMPDPTRPSAANPGGTASLRFLVIHEGQPDHAQRSIALRLSSQPAEKRFTVELRSPIAPSMTPGQLEWTRRTDQDRWQTTEIVAPAGHPEFRMLRLVADEKTIETKVEDEVDADGHPLAGRQKLSVRPIGMAGSGRFQVDAVVMTSLGERALRLVGVVKEKSEREVTGEF